MATAEKISVSPIMQIVRFCLLLFNTAFWISGFCLFVIGIWAVVELNKYDDLPSPNSYNSVAIVLIVIGLIIAAVGICGCCGALRKNIYLLKMFALFLGIIILCEVCVAVAGYAYRSKIKSALSSGLNETMQEYRNGGVLKESWDKMQENFGCCGNKNYSDWFGVWQSGNDTSVPKSCCKKPKEQKCNMLFQNGTKPDPGNQIYTEGCYDLITNFFQSKFTVLASGALGISLIQIIGIVCAGCFWTHIQNKTKYELV